MRSNLDHRISLIVSYLLATIGLLAVINILVGPF